MFRFPTLAQAAVVALPFAGYALILSLPQAGALGMVLRYNLDISLFVVGMLLWLALVPKGRLGIFTGLTAVLALFALPLAGLWASAAGEMHVLGGLLYFSDTAEFYWEANRLLEGGLFAAFGSRRPIFAGLLAGLLGLTNHNLQLAVIVLVALCAAGCFLAARELRKTHGAAAGALFLLLVFLFYRRFIGMTDTENLGLTLGAAAFALLWRGARQERRLDLLAGALLLTLALVTRAGAFLVLPALVLWASLSCPGLLAPPMGSRVKARLTAGIMIVEVIALGFLLNMAVFKFTSNGQGSPFANSAYTFYGMAAGGQGWKQIYIDAPEITRLPEGEAARKVTAMAWAMLRENPGRFARTVLDQFAQFFSLRDESVFGFASGADVVVFDAPRPEDMPGNRAVRLLLSALSLVGLYQAFRRRDAPHSLLLFLVGGMALSVAFLPPRDAGLMRVYAATLPVLAAVPAVGFAAVLDWARTMAVKKGWRKTSGANETGTAQGSGWGLTAFGLTLAAVVITMPLAVRMVAQAAPLPAQPGCLPGEESVTVRISPGAYLRVVEDSAVPRTWLPEVRQSDFFASLRSFPHREALAELEAIQPPTLLQNALDLESGQAFWLVLQDGQPVQESMVIPLCGSWNEAFHQRSNDIFLFFGVSPQG